MTFILTVCTYGLFFCGSYDIYNYPNEASCYVAMDALYKTHGKEKFNYIICSAPNEAK